MRQGVSLVRTSSQQVPSFCPPQSWKWNQNKLWQLPPTLSSLPGCLSPWSPSLSCPKCSMGTSGILKSLLTLVGVISFITVLLNPPSIFSASLKPALSEKFPYYHQL